MERFKSMMGTIVHFVSAPPAAGNWMDSDADSLAQTHDSALTCPAAEQREWPQLLHALACRQRASEGCDGDELTAAVQSTSTRYAHDRQGRWLHERRDYRSREPQDANEGSDKEQPGLARQTRRARRSHQQRREQRLAAAT